MILFESTLACSWSFHFPSVSTRNNYNSIIPGLLLNELYLFAIVYVCLYGYCRSGDEDDTQFTVMLLR